MTLPQLSPENRATLERLGLLRYADRTFPLLQIDDLEALLSAVRAEGKAGCEKERWRPVVGWENSYEVSDMGRVRSIDRDAPHNMVERQFIPGRLMVPTLNADGYPTVGLRAGKKVRKIYRVHRLVAEAFLSPVPGKTQINHIDNDRANNVLSNLEWSTQAENIAHMMRQGRGRNGAMSGMRNPNCRFSDEQVISMRDDFARGIVTRKELQAQYAAGRGVLNKILNGASYVHVPLPAAPSPKESET